MRNPWGSEEYDGPWSDKDTERWTPELKAQLGHTHADDGIFMVPIDIFRKAFRSYDITMYKDW